MTWTYSGDPSSSNRDEVRFLVGDTDTTDQQVNDAEIAYAIAEEANNRLAAARIARTLAAKYARRADKKVGDLDIKWKQLSENYKQLAEDLTSDAAIYSAMPFAGGLSVSGKEAVRDNSDRVDPSFRKGQHDNPSLTDPDDKDPWNAS